MSRLPESNPVATTVDLNRPSTVAFVIGWVLSILPAAFLLFSSVMKLLQPGKPEDIAKFLDPLGWKLEQLPGLGIVQLICVVLYLIPQTALLGAILITGYMGGVIATHIRIGDYGIVPFVVIGILIWLGPYFRYPKLRRMFPFNL